MTDNMVNIYKYSANIYVTTTCLLAYSMVKHVKKRGCLNYDNVEKYVTKARIICYVTVVKHLSLQGGCLHKNSAVNYRDKHCFSCINVCQAPREVLKTEAFNNFTLSWHQGVVGWCDGAG